MAFEVRRTPEEIEQARQRAQKAAFAAEDRDQADDAANAVYDLLQWLAGDSDADPTEEMGDDPDDGE
jgi:hypothetical protein